MRELQSVCYATPQCLTIHTCTHIGIHISSFIHLFIPHKLIPQFIIDTVLTSTIHDTCTHLHTYIQLVLCNTSIIVDMLIIHQITLTHELDSILYLFSYLYCSSLLFHSLFAGHLVFLVLIVPCEACHQSLMISHCM